MLSHSDDFPSRSHASFSSPGSSFVGMEAALNACLASMEYRDNQTHVPFLDVAQARLSRNVAVGRDAVCKGRGVTKKEHDSVPQVISFSGTFARIVRELLS